MSAIPWVESVSLHARSSSVENLKSLHELAEFAKEHFQNETGPIKELIDAVIEADQKNLLKPQILDLCQKILGAKPSPNMTAQSGLPSPPPL